MDAEALRERVIGQYSDYVNPGLARLMGFAGFGVETRAEGCHIYDQDGRKYLDCLGGYGVFALGHRHPKVIEVVKKQLDTMPLSGKTFFNQAQGALAERLASLAPGDLTYTFFSNSGAEAVEAALKFAKMATRRPKIVATEGGYHGKTLGALSVTGREKYRKPFEPLMPGASFVPFGDPVEAVTAIDGQTACMIVEVVQGEGGVHVAPPGYLKAVRKHCDAVGALLVIDEVQTGMGRTGDLFATTREEVNADILILAKALGGGVMPIGATMGTHEVWDKVFGDNPLIHTSTFGGNPLACAAGLATLDVIESEGLTDKARTIGGFIMDNLRSLVSPGSLVKEVRGRGLLIGVEFAIDDVGELVIAQLVKRGMIAAYTLNNPRVIRIEPPLVISKEQAVWACETFYEAVAETEALVSALT
ncbi:MAG: aspartate aminotransferase family protein [Chthonomonadaceae bacterium]|nr:aspartate aminotransferase family protein [Chthonomonadaceae bacterium]